MRVSYSTSSVTTGRKTETFAPLTAIRSKWLDALQVPSGRRALTWKTYDPSGSGSLVTPRVAPRSTTSSGIVASRRATKPVDRSREEQPGHVPVGSKPETVG
ncbi:MAG: hypothetical protein R3C15_14695 [Thermoleophilia bacterium]